jgi:hypothetical protein
VLKIDISGSEIVLNNNFSPRLMELSYYRMLCQIKTGTPKFSAAFVERPATLILVHLISGDKNLCDLIQLEFIHIKRTTDRYFGPAFRHEGRKDLCTEDVVKPAARSTMLRIKVTNNTSFPLYPHLILFDSGD